MVEGARLESVYTVTPYRGFESLLLRHPVDPLRCGSRQLGETEGVALSPRPKMRPRGETNLSSD